MTPKNPSYSTFIGRLCLIILPAGGVIGTIIRIFELEESGNSASLEVVLLAISTYLSWRAIRARVYVEQDAIVSRSVLRSVRVPLPEFREVVVSRDVFPAGGPLFIGDERGLVIVCRNGKRIFCPSVYGYRRVDTIVRCIRRDVANMRSG